jgi:hypothetical protein
LDSIERLNVIGERVDQIAELPVCATDTVQMFVDVPQAVRPYFILPCVGRESILQNSSCTIQCHQLTSFLLKGHLAQQIIYPVLYTFFGIFINP